MLSRFVSAGLGAGKWIGPGCYSGLATKASAKPKNKAAAPAVTKKPLVVKDSPSPVTKAPVAAKKPKGPLSAYSLFVKTEYAQMKKASPGKSFVEISRLMGRLWRELPESQKAVYLRDSQKSIMSDKAKKAPSKPPNAYATFAKEVMPEIQKQYPTLSFSEKSKLVGSMWKKVPDGEKVARKQRYLMKMEEYKKLYPQTP